VNTGLLEISSGRLAHEPLRRIPPEEWLIAEAEFGGLYTPDVWRQVLAEQRRRAREHPRRRASRYPLSGIAWCVPCDRPMAGSGYWRKDHFNRYYRCSDPDYHSSIKRSDHRGAHYVRRESALDTQEGSVRRQIEAIEARIRQSQEQRDHAQSLQEAIARLPQMLSEELTDERAEILRAMFSRYVHKVYIKDRDVIRLEFRTP